MKKARVSSFFAGIGGFDLGLENTGFESVFQCEINSFCSKVLEDKWPGVKRWEDINTLDPDSIPESEVWCGGFPCQDVSVARGAHGREGLKGKNSGLFFRFMDLIRHRLPNVVILENVVGLLSSHNGQDFRIVLEELTKCGYAVTWRVLNSRYFGAPQSRPRVFICAYKNQPIKAIDVLFEREKSFTPKSPRQGFLTADECEFSGAIVPKVAYCLAATSGRHTGTDWSRTYISYKNEIRRLTPSECEGLQGFPKGWTNLDRLGINDLDTPRYHALGNAVCVPVVEWVSKKLKTALSKNNKNKKKSTEQLIEDIKKYKVFSDKTFRYMEFEHLRYSIQANGNSLKWQSAGIAYDGFCIDVKAAASPIDILEKPLVSVVERHKPSSRYFLSKNAAEGILRRVSNQNRTLFGPLNDALHAKSGQTKAAS